MAAYLFFKLQLKKSTVTLDLCGESLNLAVNVVAQGRTHSTAKRTRGQRGDLNGDGHITTADALIVLRMAVSGEHSDDADLNGDGQGTSVDALMILQAAVGCTQRSVKFKYRGDC